jgi:hypothetical protein
MSNTQILDRRYDAIGWGALFVWWGMTELFQFLPEGSGAVGIGLILLGVNAARTRNGIPSSSFSTSLGILALVWGGLEFAASVLRLPFEIPIFAILLIVLGGIILAHELSGSKISNKKA